MISFYSNHSLEAKLRISFSFSPGTTFALKPAILVLKEVASRLYHLTCSLNILLNAPQLNLDVCFLNTLLDISEFILKRLFNGY
jgi:hypothetical protein